MEPLFRAWPAGQGVNPLAELVPQVTIEIAGGRPVSILDAGHRLGDAIVRSSTLREDARKAFAAFLDSADSRGTRIPVFPARAFALLLRLNEMWIMAL